MANPRRSVNRRDRAEMADGCHSVTPILMTVATMMSGTRPLTEPTATYDTPTTIKETARMIDHWRWKLSPRKPAGRLVTPPATFRKAETEPTPALVRPRPSFSSGSRTKKLEAYMCLTPCPATTTAIIRRRR